MSISVELGRIRAVPIRGTISLAILIGLFAAMTAWGLRTVQPGYSEFVYGVTALACAVLFVWTIYVHEVAHVVAARLFGARVNGVTLSFVGGETAISGQPGSPWQGVVVALAGPVASAACGVACFGAAFSLAALNVTALVPVAFAWVGILCLLLAIANLIPAAPLDGGHILHAAIWARTGNRVRASGVAGVAGQFVAAALLAWAGYLIVHGGRLTALSLALFAVPLWRGATATRRAARQRLRLAGARVAQVMRRRFVAVDDRLSAVDAARRVGESADDYAPVVDSAGKPVAVVTTESIRRAATGRRSLRGVLRRRTKRLITANVDEPLADVLERSHAHVVPVAVIENDRIIGIVDPRDIEERLRAASPDSVGDAADLDAWPGRRAATTP